MQITEELRDVLDSPGAKLEAGRVLSASQGSTLVLVYRVGIASLASQPPSRVVKLSRREDSVASAPTIQLATPAYFRSYGENPQTTGIRDPDESTLKEVRQLESPLSPGGIPATMSYSADHAWLFCTCLEPDWRPERHALQDAFPEYDCETYLADPPKFAIELGRAMGHHVSERDVRLDGLATIASVTGRLSGIRNVVHVHHGPILYTDNSAAALEHTPEESRTSLIPFTKGTRFAKQREYRFTVSTRGTPAQDVLRLPISEDLRALASLAA